MKNLPVYLPAFMFSVAIIPATQAMGAQPAMNPYGMQQSMQPGIQAVSPYCQPGMQQPMNPYGQPRMQAISPMDAARMQQIQQQQQQLQQQLQQLMQRERMIFFNNNPQANEQNWNLYWQTYQQQRTLFFSANPQANEQLWEQHWNQYKQMNNVR